MGSLALMIAATVSPFCVPPLLVLLINGVFAAGFVYLIWSYFKGYYALVRKLRPKLSGVQLLLIPMFEPFLINGKEARALPERWALWRPIMILVAVFISFVLIDVALADYRCS
jgi:hypothetical protein